MRNNGEPTKRHQRKKGNRGQVAPTHETVYVIGRGPVQRPIVAATSPPKRKGVTAKVPKSKQAVATPPEQKPAASVPLTEVPIAERSLADKLASPLNDLDLIVRLYNSLMRRGIDTVGKLVANTAADLYVPSAFSTKSIDEVLKVLAAIGLTLKGETLPEA